jgi:alpha-beta hydrolase superfamily lysophospholipase
MLHHRTQVLAAVDGHDIHMQLWEPEGDPAGIVQVLHGLGEHADRYARFASAAVAGGFTVVCHDHRGHGPHATEPGHFADTNGWHKVNKDVKDVNDAIREAYPEVPVIMLGHSMGSFLAQTFAMHYGGKLSGLVLSGSTWPSRFELLPARLIARIEAWRLGVAGKSPLLARLGFGAFNKQFTPTRTEFDWLSRDETEVDKYLADPMCGGPFSCSLWLDFIGGLFDLSTDHAVSRIPFDLPILISGGGADPVGGDKGMTKLAMRYAQTLHQRLTVKIYEDGRHEMLNEINRDQVTADWLGWIATTTRSGRSG